MTEQLTLWDWMPTAQPEPEVGAWVEKCGAVIPHIMRKSYIGRKVLMNKSTQSMTVYKCGILEKVVPSYYWHDDQRIECEMSIVYDGSKQRNMISHYPGGGEIYECLPWNAYEERNKAIGRKDEGKTC